MTDDAHEMELMLARYRPARPDAALRGQIVQAHRRRNAWSFVEAMAAMLLIGLNLAQIGAAATRPDLSRRNDEDRVKAITAAIVELDLPVSSEEARAMALSLAAGERVVPLPLVRGANVNMGGMP